MHPVILAQGAQGRSPHDPASHVYRLIGQTAWTDNGTPHIVELGLGVPSIPSSTARPQVDAWKLPFERAAQSISFRELPGYDVLPPAIGVFRNSTLVGVFALSSDPQGRAQARVYATECALREVRRIGQTAQSGAPATP